MFSEFEAMVVEALKSTLPEALVPGTRILAGPLASPPAVVPSVAFTSGDFEMPGEGQIFDIPRETEEMRFSVSSRLEVWADSMGQAEDIALKAMASILVSRKAIEEGSGSNATMGSLRLNFRNENFRPLKGIKLMNNGASAKCDLDYVFESVMTVTRLDFSYGEIEAVDARTEVFGISKDVIRDDRFLTTPQKPVLLKPPIFMKWIGSATGNTLSLNGIHSIAHLALADTDRMEVSITGMANHIKRAREIWRISDEVLSEIEDNEYPFPEEYFTLALQGILDKETNAPGAVEAETGKPAERAAALIANINTLKNDLLDSIDPIGLKDFIKKTEL